MIFIFTLIICIQKYIYEGLTTSVGDPGSGSAYFHRDPDPQIRDPDPRIFTGFQIRDQRSARKTVRISNTGFECKPSRDNKLD